jgi:hypothetical protein
MSRRRGVPQQGEWVRVSMFTRPQQRGEQVCWYVVVMSCSLEFTVEATIRSIVIAILVI